jgi:hypothetical protein
MLADLSQGDDFLYSMVAGSGGHGWLSSSQD